jgi:hypothetical protein
MGTYTNSFPVFANHLQSWTTQANLVDKTKPNQNLSEDEPVPNAVESQAAPQQTKIADEHLAKSSTNPDYQFYFFDPAYKQLLDQPKQVELLQQLLNSAKPKPENGVYYVSYVQQDQDDLLISIATKTLQEEADQPSKNIDDHFFTVKLGKPEHTGSQTAGLMSASNPYPNYKLPWRAGEAWRTENINPNNGEYWGWHRDQTGPALDFNPPQGSSMDLLSSGPGKVVWKCQDTHGQAGMHVRTIDNGTDYGETLRYYHFDSSEVYVNTYEVVEQGKLLGKLSDKATNPTSPSCNLPSDTVHLHFGFPYTPITFENYTFVEDGELYADEDLFSTQYQIVDNLRIVSPQSGNHLEASFRYPIEVEYYGDLDLLNKIEIFDNEIKLQEITTPPFDNLYWYAQHPGNRNLKIVAYYSDGTQSLDSIDVRVDFGQSAWKSDKNTQTDVAVDMVRTPSGQVLQTQVEPSGTAFTRLSTTTDIISNPNSWTNWQNAGNPSTSKPVSSIVFDGKIWQYLVAKDNRIYARSSTDGASWTGWSENGSAYSALGSTVFNGKIYQVYLNDQDQVYYRHSADGQTWSTGTSALMDSNYSPSITAQRGRIYQTAVGLDQHIYTRSSADGTAWSAWQNVPDIGEYAYRPASIQAVGQTLFQTHQGTDNKIYLRASYDQGTTWTDWATDGSLTQTEPKMQEIGEELYQTKIGTDGYVYWRKLHYYQISEAELM